MGKLPCHIKTSGAHLYFINCRQKNINERNQNIKISVNNMYGYQLIKHTTMGLSDVTCIDCYLI